MAKTNPTNTSQTTGQESAAPPSWADRVKKLGTWAVEKITETPTPVPDALTSGIKLDIEGRRLFLPHPIVESALRFTLTQVEGVDLRSVSCGSDGYRIRAQVKGRDVGALIVPRLVRWSDGVVLVEAQTPEGVQSYDRSFAAACVVAYATLFGGSPMVKILVDQIAPKGWSWDGENASWKSDIAGRMDLPDFIRSATGAELTATLTDEGAWLALTKASAGVNLKDVSMFLAKQALSRALGR